MKKRKIPWLPILTVLLGLITYFVDPAALQKSLTILWSFLREMLQVLPFVLILASLVSEWVPSETIRRHLGEESGFRGSLFAYLLGSLSAGPIYAAFPLALALKKKGASVRNLTVMISTWAVIKIPMLFMELKSLGPRFTLIRYGLTLPSILILGLVMERLVKKEEMSPRGIEKRADPSRDAVLDLLPGTNCGGCGFGSCAALFRAYGGDEVTLRKKCLFLE